jgi:hypothetical protein
MEHLKLRRDVQLKYWIGTLEEIIQEFPGSNMNIDTAIKSFKSQLKELENKQ